MKKLIPLLIVAGFMFSFQAGLAQDHAYVGVKRCKMCHKGEKNAMIFESWQKTRHAQAFATLAEDAAKEVYAELGKSGNPQEDPQCLRCHTTGFEADTSRIAKLVIENGISCEACHGAGGDYWKKKIMQDKEAAVTNGLILDPSEGCVSCHNEESPTYKPFDFSEFWPKIEHSLPEKVEEN